MTKIILAVNSKSSQRTTNRLRENGPEFHISRELPEVHIKGQKVRARLVHSVRTNWVGWLPNDEVIIVKYEEN